MCFCSHKSILQQRLLFGSSSKMLLMFMCRFPGGPNLLHFLFVSYTFPSMHQARESEYPQVERAILISFAYAILNKSSHCSSSAARLV